MATGQTIINQALTSLNILDAGGSVAPSENADLLIELNAMISGWSIEDTLVPSIATAQYQLTADQNPYPIGPAATAPFNVARPIRITQAVLVSTVGSATRRRPLRIVGSTEYFAHGDIGSIGTTAEELYPDYADSATDAMNLYLWPIPHCPTVTKLELEAWNAIAAFALAVDQKLPNGYQDAICYGLAFRCLPRYGAVVSAETAAIVTQLGVNAKDRIKNLNVKNRLLDPALAPENQQRAAQAQQQPPK